MAASTLRREGRPKPIRISSVDVPAELLSEPVEAGNWPIVHGLAVVSILGTAIAMLLGAESAAIQTSGIFIAALSWGLLLLVLYKQVPQNWLVESGVTLKVLLFFVAFEIISLSWGLQTTLSSLAIVFTSAACFRLVRPKANTHVDSFALLGFCVFVCHVLLVRIFAILEVDWNDSTVFQVSGVMAFLITAGFGRLASAFDVARN